MRQQSTEPASGIVNRMLTNVPKARRPTVALIDTEALRHNFREVVRLSGDRDVLAVVKANAYGHGAVPVARCFSELGAKMLGVALVEEGKQLREAGLTDPILIMGAVFPDQAEEIVELNLTPAVFTLPVVRALSRAAVARNTTVAVHVKIDTGMGRVGVACSDIDSFLEDTRKFDRVAVRGLMTHFADADLRDKAYAETQIAGFESVLRSLAVKNIDIPVRHAANSAAVLDFHRALFTMVRPGLMLYGYNPLEAEQTVASLDPAMSLKTRIAYLKKVAAGTCISYGRTFIASRESLIATIPIGYADGYSRGLSNKADVLIRGKRAPIAGRVCMDMCMADVTEIPDAAEGDEVVLIGRQGGEHITADELAEKTGTIAYEVLCGISSRVPRIYQ